MTKKKRRRVQLLTLPTTRLRLLLKRSTIKWKPLTLMTFRRTWWLFHISCASLVFCALPPLWEKRWRSSGTNVSRAMKMNLRANLTKASPSNSPTVMTLPIHSLTSLARWDYSMCRSQILRRKVKMVRSKPICWEVSFRWWRAQTIGQPCKTSSSKTINVRWLTCRPTIRDRPWWCSRMLCNNSSWDSKWLDSRCSVTIWCSKRDRCI